MKPHPRKTQIIVAIQVFMDKFRPGDTLRSEEICKAVKRHMGLKYIYEGTILRYLRQMREKGRVNYTCINKRDRIFKVIKPGEWHSY